MVQSQLSVSVSFENELAKYLKNMAEIQNKTIPEVLVDFVKEQFEEDIELSKIANERDVDGAETVDFEDIEWK